MDSVTFQFIDHRDPYIETMTSGHYGDTYRRQLVTGNHHRGIVLLRSFQIPIHRPPVLLVVPHGPIALADVADADVLVWREGTFL